MLIEHGKLPLSQGAMKAAAKSLKALNDNPGKALDALRAGLRHDMPRALIFPAKAGSWPEIRITAPLTWYISEIGSGAKEVSNAIARTAAGNGWNTIRNFATNELAARWHPDEVIVQNFYDTPKGISDRPMTRRMASPQEVLERRLGLKDVLARHGQGRQFALEIMAPDLCRLPDPLFREYCAYYRDLAAQMSEGTLVILDLWHFDLSALRDLSTLLRFHARTKGCQVLLHVRGVGKDFSEWGIGSEDGLIFGKSSVQVDGIGVDFGQFKEGQCLIPTQSGPIELEGPYFGLDLDRPSVFGPDLLAIAERMAEKISEQRPKTHIERLEIVARGCGYRDWHAAQGRKVKPEAEHLRAPSSISPFVPRASGGASLERSLMERINAALPFTRKLDPSKPHRSRVPEGCADIAPIIRDAVSRYQSILIASPDGSDVGFLFDMIKEAIPEGWDFHAWRDERSSGDPEKMVWWTLRENTPHWLIMEGATLGRPRVNVMEACLSGHPIALRCKDASIDRAIDDIASEISAHKGWAYQDALQMTQECLDLIITYEDRPGGLRAYRGSKRGFNLVYGQPA